MKRILFFLFFFNAVLHAQQPTWQAYYHISNFTKGIDMGEILWLSGSQNVIVKYDKASGVPTLFSVKDFGLNSFLNDMMKGKDGQLFFMDSRDGPIIEWKDGVGSHWPNDPLLNSASLSNFIGQTHDGALLIRTANGRIIHFDKELGASYITYLPNVMSGQIRNGNISNDGHFMAWTYRHLVLFNKNGDLMEDLNFQNEFIYGAEMDEDGFIWIHTGEKIWNYSPITTSWATIDITNLGSFIPNKIRILSDHRAIVMDAAKGMIILESDGTDIYIENINTGLFENNYFFYSAPLDDDDTFWYISPRSSNLNSWKIGNNPNVITETPWLSTSNINAITQDKQGKVWLGGFYNMAYHLGGEWTHQAVADPFSFSQVGGVNEIEFTHDNRPIIGTGSLGFFGARPSFVLEWNGHAWDTLHQAVLGSSIFPVTDIEIDQQENLWVLNDFNTFFSVRSRGQWTRYKNTDMPINANVFTFLKEAPDGQMWIGTDKGIVTYDGYQFLSIDSTTLLLENTGVEDVCFDDKGQIWVTTIQDGIRKWNGFQWEVLKPHETLEVTAAMGKIIQGVGDEMWVVMGWDGVLHFDGQEWEHLTSSNSGLVENQVLTIMKDKQDRIWFGGSQSVSILHPEEHIFTPFELSSTNHLAVYPNPACCLFRVQWKQEQQADVEIQLINITGQLIKNWSFDGQSMGEHFLDIKQDGFSQGTYSVRLLLNGEALETIPLIVVD